MPGVANILKQSIEVADLPSVETRINYSQNIPRAFANVADPSKTYRPLEAHTVTMRDGRPIRDQFDLDEQGFVLLDHKSSVSHLRESKDLDRTYHEEMRKVVYDVSGASLVIPYRTYLQVRQSGRAPGAAATRSDVNQPAGFVHMDITQKTFLNWVKWVQEDEGIVPQSYSRVCLYQTWRAVSPPPQDFPLALTDGRSVKPGKYVIMDNFTTLEEGDHTVETRLGLYDPDDRWYYFSNMKEDEVLIFKGYDSKFNDNQNILHTSFDNTPKYPNASPRESIEARFFAFWR